MKIKTLSLSSLLFATSLIQCETPTKPLSAETLDAGAIDNVLRQRACSTPEHENWIKSSNLTHTLRQERAFFEQLCPEGTNPSSDTHKEECLLAKKYKEFVDSIEKVTKRLEQKSHKTPEFIALDNFRKQVLEIEIQKEMLRITINELSLPK